MRVALIALPLLVLAGCGTAPPSRINNICAVLDQRDGFMNSWTASAEKAERRWGVPSAVLLATIRVESGFDGKARPPRKDGFLFFPGKRLSTAYGYSQALDGTWDRYKRETGNRGAKRNNFDDAVDFVGWHHRLSHETNGVALSDTYNLYANYYSGHAGWRRGAWQSDPGIVRAARKAEKMALDYQGQMRGCGR